MGRPKTPRISRERAARAALDVVDVHGLNGLSLELVARQIGVRAPSLYYHFKDKSELLSEVALLIMREIKVAFSASDTWEDMMVRVALATRRTILLHPNAAPLLLEFFPRHFFQRAYDYWIGKCPYPQEFRLMVSESVEKLTYGSTLFAAASRTKGVPQMPDLDPSEYPAFAAAVRSNPYDEEALFEQSVRVFLAGAATLAATKTKPKAAPRAKAKS